MDAVPLVQERPCDEELLRDAQRSCRARCLLVTAALAAVSVAICIGGGQHSYRPTLRGWHVTRFFSAEPLNPETDAADPFLYEHGQHRHSLPVRHRGYDCWQSCLGAGLCSDFCGEGNACCRKGATNDPPECAKITDFWTNHHECVKPVVQVQVNHFAQDCWPRCEIGGDCQWCGSGQACCRKNSTLDPPECHGVVDWPTDRHHTCVTPVKDIPVKHEGQDCFNFCGGRGHCSWCGEGNACCKYGDEFDVAECRAVVYFSATTYHVCVKPSFPKALTMPLHSFKDSEKDCASGLVMDPVTRSCVLPKTAQRLTFYVYRLGNGTWSNANAGSIGAVMYAIHTKILGCPRQHGIDRIHRLKVTMKNTEEMFRKQGHEFGPLHHFKHGQCISSFCHDTFREFGYTVGCSVTSTGARSYPSQSQAAWYSLPGACPSLPEGQKTQQCILDFPGGECSDPNGSHNCTYHLEDAGTVLFDELSGRDTSTTFLDWCAAGNVEYNAAEDRGVGMHFWNQLKNGSLGKERMYKLAYLFWKKHPKFPKRLPEPCMRIH